MLKDCVIICLFLCGVVGVLFGANAIFQPLQDRLHNEKLLNIYLNVETNVTTDAYGTVVCILKHDNVVTIISAGPDTEFGTEDDVIISGKRSEP